MNRVVNQATIDLIKRFEGCRLDAYQDVVGVWTIGYGHTGGFFAESGMTITQEQADALLVEDIGKFAEGVGALVGTISTSDNEFGAMVSLAYNIGLGNFSHSHVLTYHREGDFTSAAMAFLMWNKAGGRVFPGLVTRRKAESTLYKTP